MRKLLLFALLLPGSLVWLAGYEVAVISDTHYDSLELRPGLQPKQVKGSTKRNLDAWQKKMPDYLKLYRARASKADFVIHCGDIAQGYFSKVDDTAEIQAVQKGISTFAEGIPGKLYCVKGNHETYCVNQAASSDKVIADYLKGIGVTPEKLNYSLMHQGDLYIFFDCNKPDVEFVRRTLAANPKSRYTFFVTHFPVLPCSTNNPGWIVLNKKKQQAKLKELVSMLAARNAVILCGHIHVTTLIQAAFPEGTLTQATVFSLPIGNRKGNAKEEDVNGFLNRKNAKGNTALPPHLLEVFGGRYQKFIRYTPMCGLHLLQVGDQDAVILHYDIKGTLSNTITLKQQNRE